MANILDRIQHPGIPEGVAAIPVHAYLAHLAEVVRGSVTSGDFSTYWNLDATEQANMTTMFNRIQADTIQRELVDDVLTLYEAGVYDQATALTRLLG